MDEFEDDFFDRNIDQLDVRETPRWELSEEEPCDDSDVETLVNQKKDGKVIPREAEKAKPKPVSSIPNATCNPSSNVKPVVYHDTRQLPAVQPQSIVHTSTVASAMPPILLPRNLHKKKFEELVKTTYKDEGDSVKAFGGVEREKRAVGQSQPWQDDDDADSIKDYTSNDRKKEEQYMERTDEAIYQRASEEHIKRPPLWHDDEVDSLRDFGQISCKQEVPSGITSQQISRVPSDEEICLSPPWIEEDDCQVRNMACPETDCKSFPMGKIVVEQRIQQVPPWQDDDNDFTKNYAAFWKTGSKENSRRPSDENIYLTPPWMEDDRESCGNRSSHLISTSSRINLEEKRTIEEEVRNSEIASAIPQTLDNGQQDSKPEVQIPGRDSGFSSEQDQHNQQAQVCSIVQDYEGFKSDVCSSELSDTAAATIKITKELLPNTKVENVQATDQPSLPERQISNDLPVQTSTNICLVVTNQHIDDDQRCQHVYREQLQGAPHDGNLLRKNKQEQIVKPVVQSTDTNLCGVRRSTNKGIARSLSQSSLEANCYSPHDALEGLETSSVVSFASTAATHHDLDTRIDMMQSLISMLGTHDKDDMSRTLLAMSNSKDSCAAMRQSGCLPLLIDLIHGHDNHMAKRDCRARAGLSLHNIVYSNPDDRRGRREIRVLRLLEVVRAHCDSILYSNLPPHPCAERWYPPLRDHGPGPAVAALMKLSFEEEHRNAICELGGCQAVGELVEIDHKMNADCNDLYSVSLRKYAGMTLTNLTFGNTKNKTILCQMENTIKALISQLKTTKEEELVHVSASVLRNLSWRADEVSREALRKIGAVRALTEAAQNANSEVVLRTLLSGLWNLSAHCPENKTELCKIPGALTFFTRSLNYCSPSGNISVIESSGGILRNLSSHIAVLPECRQILRENGCFQTLLGHLRSPSLRVVSNACGALWNLSARCVEDQQLLWELGAISILKSLANSKHKATATASAAALRNLMAVKPAGNNATDKSGPSCSPKRHGSLPSANRLLETKTKQKHCAMATKSSDKHSARSLSYKASTKLAHVASPRSSDAHSTVKATQNSSVDVSHEAVCSASSIDQGIVHSRKKSGHIADPHRSSSLTKANTKTVSSNAAVDSSSMGSTASTEGRHGHLGRWSGSNDSLVHHRRHRNKNENQQDSTQPTSAGEHSRSSSDGCAVIQLLTDSYPLQVTAKPNTSHRPSESLQCKDNTSVVSPATSRRLNQWAEDQAIESIEMSQLYICAKAEQRHVSNPLVAESRESLGSSSSRHRKKHSKKFRSYRDSDSEREADIDSDDEKNVFGVKAGGFANAWIKGKYAVNQVQIFGRHPTCLCKDAANVWIRNSKREIQGFCKNCVEKSNGESPDSRPVVKSRRDSSDSPLSSPNTVRHADMDNEPCKRGVKVTSL